MSDLYNRIEQESSELAAEDESDFIRFEIYSFFYKLCVNIMHSLFGITFVLFLLKLSAGKTFGVGPMHSLLRIPT
jgi:hypothetical protein